MKKLTRLFAILAVALLLATPAAIAATYWDAYHTNVLVKGYLGGPKGDTMDNMTTNYWKVNMSSASGIFNILTGNLKVGNGTPDVTLNGNDAYVTGTLEVDGLFTGSLGATISGAVINLNASSNFATNIGTGTSTGTVTIGGAAAQTIAIGNGAAAKTVTLGSTNTTSATTINAGSGKINLVGELSTGDAITGDGTAALGGFLKTVTDDADGEATIGVAESGSVQTNAGAAGAAAWVLPDAAAGLNYTFVVMAAQELRVTPAAGDKICIAGVCGDAAEYWSADAVGESLTLVAVDGTNWVATSYTGTWSQETP